MYGQKTEELMALKAYKVHNIKWSFNPFTYIFSDIFFKSIPTKSSWSSPLANQTELRCSYK
jgi:hypothetical protein